MKKNLKTINDSIEMFDDMQHHQALNNLYSRISSGSCKGCGHCCAESVHLFYSEFINLYKYLISEDLLDSTIEKVKVFHKQEWTVAQKCIFLQADNRCGIYPVRPLVCRLFGHKSKSQHNKDYRTIKKRNKAVDKWVYDQYGVHIAKEVLNHKIKYCKSFAPRQVMTTKDHQLLMDDLYGLEMHYLSEDLMDDQDFEKSLTQWFIDFFVEDYKGADIKVENLLKKKS